MSESCRKHKVLYVTTVKLAEGTGGASYSRSVFEAVCSHFDTQLLVLEEEKLLGRNLGRAIAVVSSPITRTPPAVLFHSSILRARARRLLRSSWDAIVVDHLESAGVLGELVNTPVIYVSHNRESLLTETKFRRFPKWLKRVITQWIDGYEDRLASSANGVICISADEAKWYEGKCSNTVVVYPSFAVQARVPRARNSPLRIGFLGGGGWKPNADALDVLIERIFPELNREVTFVLGGAGWNSVDLAERVSATAPRGAINVEVLGFIKDIRSFWESIDVFLAPMVSGAGTNVKVCEALANGVPVVALPAAIRGFNAAIASCNGLRVARTEIEFARLVENFCSEEMMEFDTPLEFRAEDAIERVGEVIFTAVARSTKAAEDGRQCS